MLLCLDSLTNRTKFLCPDKIIKVIWQELDNFVFAPLNNSLNCVGSFSFVATNTFSIIPTSFASILFSGEP
jgi:hypothetical protein